MLKVGFSVRGTKGGNTTIAFDDGKEVAVSGPNADAVANLIAEAYRAKFPEGEVSARGTITTSVELS